MKSLKNNFFYNLMRTLSNLLFPILIQPYISRVLLPEGIGKVAFVNSIVGYFLIFAGLGIPIYGIREISKVKDDKIKLRKVSTEIFTINILITMIVVLVYIVMLYNNLLGKEHTLLEVLGLNIFLTTLGVEWYFQGLEEYKYITIRGIIFRIISLGAIYLFVKDRSDYIIYAFILVISNVGSNILNFIKFYKVLYFKKLSLKYHLKPICTIFSMNLAISIYTNLDSVMLGYLATERAVGLYNSGTKLVKLTLGLVTSLSAVLLPRISNYIKNDKKEELDNLLNEVFRFLVIISFPCTIGLFFTSKEIILIFSGENFIEAIMTMKILVPIIVFIAFSNFVGIQILYSHGEDKKVLFSVVVGAIINFGLNCYLIPSYFQNGAAFATTIAEGMITLIQIVIAKKYLKNIKIDKEILKIIFSNMLMGVILLGIDRFLILNNICIKLIIKIGISIVVYMSSLIILKNKFLLEMLNKIRKRGSNNV